LADQLLIVKDLNIGMHIDAINGHWTEVGDFKAKSINTITDAFLSYQFRPYLPCIKIL